MTIKLEAVPALIEAVREYLEASTDLEELPEYIKLQQALEEVEGEDI